MAQPVPSKLYAVEQAVKITPANTRLRLRRRITRLTVRLDVLLAPLRIIGSFACFEKTHHDRPFFIYLSFSSIIHQLPL
jgi:hypothetical protein